MSDISQQVIELIANTQSLDPAGITLDSTFEDLGIDSVAAISIAFDMESAFDIDFSDDDMYGLKSVRDVVEGVEKLLAEKG